MPATPPRVVLVTRRTDYEALLERHGTRGQAAFFLQTRGQQIEALEAVHREIQGALAIIRRAIPEPWRFQQVDRGDLDRFLFEPDDLVVALGQDGLVANVAKYLSGQPVIGVNPLPGQYDGVLVPHAPRDIEELLQLTAAGGMPLERRTMVAAEIDDGQRLLALNEVFIGHESHQSARYLLSVGTVAERQSSSGLIVATGTGATGWARSIHQATRSTLALPAATEAALVFFVREAFPSIATGTGVTEGLLEGDGALQLTAEMNSGGVIFGDGIEADRIELRWGQRVSVQRADTSLNLVTG